MKELIIIGFDKNGEADFGIRRDFSDLTLEQLQELRKIIPVAIYVAEDMWHRNQTNEAKESLSPTSKELLINK